MQIARVFRNYYRAFTRNLKYDRETTRILRRVLKPDSSCIDVGSRHGKILRRMIHFAPKGKHSAFEPLPQAFRRLHEKFGGERSVRLHNVALADEKGRRPFVSVIRYPGYSGFRRHYYPGETRCEEISVNVWALDEVIPAGAGVDFIKIDVEGAEWLVLKGAERLLKEQRPWVLFEHGVGGASYYGVEPGQLFDSLTEWGFHISLLESFLKDQGPLTRESFVRHYKEASHFYFLAYPPERYAKLLA